MTQNDDSDLGPGLLALGALVLGVGAVVAIWSSGATESASEPEEPWAFWGDPESAGPPGRRAASDPDAGVAMGHARIPVGSYEPGVLPGEEEDPQVFAMRRSFGDDAGMAASFTPYLHAGRAIMVAGVDGVADRASCDVRVLPVLSPGGFNCVVRVRCDGVTVYPDSALEAGYAPCEIEGGIPRLATDRAPTDRDGDPELVVDVSTRRVRVHDIRHGNESTVEIQLD
jgi:hypothetical protein